MSDKLKQFSKKLKNFKKTIKNKKYDEILLDIKKYKQEIKEILQSPEIANSPKYEKSKKKLNELENMLSDMEYNVKNLKELKEKWQK